MPSKLRDFVYDVVARNPGDDSVMELRLCGHCSALGRVMIINKKPNFTGAECEWCERGNPDLREVIQPKCDCQPPVYRWEAGHREAANGESVPCILLACAHPPCEAWITVDFDWPRLGIPKFYHMNEGHS